jgi:hypothetical protein
MYLPTTQAITEMTRQLRKGKGKGERRNGLILANGGWVTYQHVICLSTMPRRQQGGAGAAYPDTAPLPDGVTDVPVPPVDVKVDEGEQDSVIEVSVPVLALLDTSGNPLAVHEPLPLPLPLPLPFPLALP